MEEVKKSLLITTGDVQSNIIQDLPCFDIIEYAVSIMPHEHATHLSHVG